MEARVGQWYDTGFWVSNVASLACISKIIGKCSIPPFIGKGKMAAKQQQNNSKQLQSPQHHLIWDALLIATSF